MSENKVPEQELNPGTPQGQTPENGKKKRGYVKYSPLSLVLLAVCAFVFSFSMLGLFEQVILDFAGQSEMGGTGGGSVFVPEPGDDTDVVVPPLTGDDPLPESKWQQIAPSQINTDDLPYLQNVGFDTLKNQNEDTVAWMYWPTTTDVKGLPFNMAVVQSTNNEFYLNRSFDKSNNANGWIYADYRCNMEDLTSNRNVIIYGHARSYLMFGGLRFLNSKTKWQQDGYNHFIYINTPNERTVWQVFAWYETTTAFNYINTYFSGDAEYVEFLNSLQSKNMVSAFEKFNFTPEDRILTLSTCKGVNSDVRIAIHAVLVKQEWIDGRKPAPDLEDVTDDATGVATTDSVSEDDSSVTMQP